MKLVLLNKKLDGETLAVALYNTNGILYMNKGVVLNEVGIKKIQKMGINTVYIEDGSDEFTLQQVIDPSKKITIIRKLNEKFKLAKKEEMIKCSEIESIANELIENLNLSENAFLFNSIGKLDDSLNLEIHSIDVAILSLMVGINKNYNGSKLLNLCISALLHDVGKLFDSGKKHVDAGYKLLKKTNDFPSTTAIGVLHHHERVDGKGYPDGLKDDKIYEFGKIISICDEYANLTSNENAYFPLEIIEKITADTNQKYDFTIYKDFTASIYCYPNGIRVSLTNGIEGKVIMQNKGFPLRPIIQVVIKSKKYFVNLLSENSLAINKILID